MQPDGAREREVSCEGRAGPEPAACHKPTGSVRRKSIGVLASAAARRYPAPEAQNPRDNGGSAVAPNQGAIGAVAQLVEQDPPKVKVAGSNPVGSISHRSA